MSAVSRSHESWRRCKEQVLRFLRRDIWMLEVSALPRLLGFLTRVGRVLLIAVRGFVRDRCLNQAAALTYGTIFSLPSVLAFGFAAAKGFNLYGKLKTGAIEPFLDSTFGTRASGAAPELRAAVDQIFAYVDRSDLAALGGIALAFVVYAVLKLLGSVEGSLNDIWGVRRARTLLRRVSDYLAIVVIAPVLLLTAMAVTTFVEGSAVSSSGAVVTSPAAVEAQVTESGAPFVLPPSTLSGEPTLSIRVLSLLAVWLGLSFVYKTLPNTRVTIGAAVLGGVVAGSIWQAVQILHLEGQIHLARYNAIYSSFAAIPMLLLWIYVSWGVFLVGAELAFAFQNEAAFTSMARTGKVDQAFRERIAPRLAGRITRAFLDGRRAPSTGELAGELGVAPRTVAQVLESLAAANLLARASDGLDDGYLPARDPETITVLDLLHALRREEGASTPPTRNRLDERADRLLSTLEEENSRSLANYTLRELAQTSESDAPEPALPGQPRAAENAS